jgi:hypothetical protein
MPRETKNEKKYTTGLRGSKFCSPEGSCVGGHRLVWHSGIGIWIGEKAPAMEGTHGIGAWTNSDYSVSL